MESKPNLGLNEKMSLFYPDQLWKWVPPEVDAWDTDLQKLLRDTDNPFWRWVERISDTGPGIAITFAVLFMMWFLFGERSRHRFFYGVRIAIIFLVFLTVSDFISHKLLKIPIGRLKPRVNGIIPNFYQALSFPSSHAFNMVFGWNLMRLYLGSLSVTFHQKRLRVYLYSLLPLIFLS